MPIILLILGIIIIILSLRLIKKEDKSFSKIVKEKKEDSSEVNIEIAEIRRTFGETITDLQLEIRELKEEIEVLKKSKENKEMNKEKKDYLDKDVISDINFKNIKKDKKIKNKNEFEPEKKLKIENNIKKSKEENKKSDKINELIEKGFTDEEICQKLSIGKGEVLLVRNLLRK